MRKIVSQHVHSIFLMQYCTMQMSNNTLVRCLSRTVVFLHAMEDDDDKKADRLLWGFAPDETRKLDGAILTRSRSST